MEKINNKLMFKQIQRLKFVNEINYSTFRTQHILLMLLIADEYFVHGLIFNPYFSLKKGL